MRTESATPKQISYLKSLLGGKFWCQDLTEQQRDALDLPARGPLDKALGRLSKAEASAAIEQLTK